MIFCWGCAMVKCRFCVYRSDRQPVHFYPLCRIHNQLQKIHPPVLQADNDSAGGERRSIRLCTISAPGMNKLTCWRDDERNAPLTPKDVTYGSHQKVWWYCASGHHWQAKIYSRSAGSGCPYCSGRLAEPKKALRMCYPELEPEWDAEKMARCNSPS